MMAAACATQSPSASPQAARLAEDCRSSGLSARQCRCFAERLPQEVSPEELNYLVAQVDNPALAEEMAARDSELLGMGLANRVMIVMAQCGPRRSDG